MLEEGVCSDQCVLLAKLYRVLIREEGSRGGQSGSGCDYGSRGQDQRDGMVEEGGGGGVRSQAKSGL